jgi:hypothetical protein
MPNKGSVHFAHLASGRGVLPEPDGFVDTRNASLVRSGLLLFGDTSLTDLPERLEGGDEERRLAKSSCSPIRLGGGEDGPEEIVAVSE